MLVAFHLPSRPRSLNAKVKESYAKAIREAAQQKYSGGLTSGALYSRIIWFHKYRSTQGDADNIAKRIHDALKGIVFADDGVITHTMTARVDATVDVEVIADTNHPDVAADLAQSLGNPEVRDVLYVEVGHQTNPQVYLGPLQ